MAGSEELRPNGSEKGIAIVEKDKTDGEDSKDWRAV